MAKICWNSWLDVSTTDVSAEDCIIKTTTIKL